MSDDGLLASWRDELRVVLAALNDLYHPVYPGDPARIAALERQVCELRTAITEHRRARIAAGDG